jgi:hypothetical protein
MKARWAFLTAAVLCAAVSGSQAAQFTISTAPPPAADEITDGPSSQYELGMKFQTDVAGQILALRYWQPRLETGSHTGHLWTNDGSLLETVSFANEAPGWMEAELATPVDVLAGVTYIVSVNCNVYYPDTEHGLDASLVNGPIHSLVGANGVYADDAGTFPTNEWHNSNYYRDVVFQSAPEPGLMCMLALGGISLLRRRR